MSEFSKSDYKYFDLARREAMNSTYNGFKLGAVIVYKGHVISRGHNSNKTNPMQKKYNQKYRTFRRGEKPVNHSLHAEMDSIINIPKCIDVNMDYAKAKIYIYRISPGKRLGLGLASPCPACRHALRDKGFRDIYYTTDDGFAHERFF